MNFLTEQADRLAVFRGHHLLSHAISSDVLEYISLTRLLYLLYIDDKIVVFGIFDKTLQVAGIDKNRCSVFIGMKG